MLIVVGHSSASIRTPRAHRAASSTRTLTRRPAHRPGRRVDRASWVAEKGQLKSNPSELHDVVSMPAFRSRPSWTLTGVDTSTPQMPRAAGGKSPAGRACIPSDPVFASSRRAGVAVFRRWLLWAIVVSAGRSGRARSVGRSASPLRGRQMRQSSSVQKSRSWAVGGRAAPYRSGVAAVGGIPSASARSG